MKAEVNHSLTLIINPKQSKLSLTIIIERIQTYSYCVVAKGYMSD